jgi:hypothetical protein
MSTFIFYFFFYAASRELQMAGDRCPLTIVLLRENENLTVMNYADGELPPGRAM